MCLSNRSALQGATWRLAEVFDGLVLAGGQSRRMRTAHGGQADKGLMTWRGEPLVAHACRQLRAQGAGSLWISANRHFDDYAAYGTVVSDDPAHADCGPLAGVLAGLRRSRSPWLFVLPVDVLRWPEDLGARLGAAARPGSPAYACTPDGPHPLCLMAHRDLADGLQAYLDAGGRQVQGWLRSCGAAAVDFPGADVLVNLNTPEDWERWR
ncbi:MULTISPECIES: molybdenum cofactor guanylyltransferase MobA [Castellaniella]|jgi:molybdopterin-guanine dinucleotide biosynthesis protein A|uniref:molybdenum cofactor guanylyltransferase MobA n=1 Tax=Castellaniella TaxID=359336 RepID=UPI002D7F94C6|nr:molybdenum cofactor guanylyltransferase MobA [Castellaniella sp.]HET8704548.1 molybdenum cofactor guanylyltransferase MobA [Castellaniella sp.]